MLPNAKSRRAGFRPALDRLESLCLLSGGMRPPALVHAQAVVDLKPTPVGADAIRVLSDSTPKTARQKLNLNSLTADDATNKVTGRASGIYHVSVIGTITATIAFKTDVDKPRAKDVKVSVDRFSSFLTSSAKQRVQKAVVSFLVRDHNKIVALLHPATT